MKLFAGGGITAKVSLSLTSTTYSDMGVAEVTAPSVKLSRLIGEDCRGVLNQCRLCITITWVVMAVPVTSNFSDRI